MDYSELLKDPRWQRKRLEVFNRDGWACVRCKDTFTSLQVHHLYYLPGNKPWEYPESSLQTLCCVCHTKVEFYKWLVKSGLNKLRRDGFLAGDISEIQALLIERVEHNAHYESLKRYTDNIKSLIYG